LRPGRTARLAQANLRTTGELRPAKGLSPGSAQGKKTIEIKNKVCYIINSKSLKHWTGVTVDFCNR